MHCRERISFAKDCAIWSKVSSRCRRCSCSWAPRLRDIGIEVADPFASDEFPEHRLYDLLAAEDSDGAHSRYNALIRRLVSFERAAECVSD